MRTSARSARNPSREVTSSAAAGSSSSRNVGLGDQRSGERDALRLTAGQGVRPAVGEVRYAELFKRLERPWPTAAPGYATASGSSTLRTTVAFSRAGRCER